MPEKIILVDVSKSLYDTMKYLIILEALNNLKSMKAPEPDSAYIFPPSKLEKVCDGKEGCWTALYNRLARIYSLGGRFNTPLGEALANLTEVSPPGSDIIVVVDGEWNTIKNEKKLNKIISRIQTQIFNKDLNVIVLLVRPSTSQYEVARLLLLDRIEYEPIIDSDDLAETIKKYV